MSTELDDRLLPMVLAMVARLGKTVSFERVTTAGTYDEVTRKYTGRAFTNTSVKVSPPAAYKSYQIDGDKVQVGDAFIILPAKDLGWVPEKDWNVTIDGKKLRIIKVQTLYSGELIAAWKLQLRT